MLSAYLLHDQALQIAMEVDEDRRSQDRSRFAPYYRSLPVAHVAMLPAQWPEQLIQERIKGSYLERQLRAKRRKYRKKWKMFEEVKLIEYGKTW